MAEDPRGKTWVVVSLVILIGFLESFAAHGARTPIGSHNHADENQGAEPTAVAMGLESGSGKTVQTSTPTGAVSGTRGNTAHAKQKSLTAFFVIGFIVNILLISAFMFWAVGQWRKTKRE